MKYIFLTLMVFSALMSYGQKKKEDIKAIMDMCGCYDVRFNFAETFAPDKDYEFHENYRSGALEYIFPIESSKDKIVLQHLLVIGDTMIIKHWRQDWLYENTDLFVYDQDNTWKYIHKTADEVKGQWTQKVYQVDDGPRYEGTATWAHHDGRHYWESNADAPLPRREFSKRKDYNVMARRNRQEITDYGWVHEQDNDKLIREESDDTLLAREKGWNTYTKTDDSKCQVAKEWWAANKQYWADVRAVWDELFAKKQTVALNMKVDDKILFQRIFALGNEVDYDNYDSEAIREQLREILKLHWNSAVKMASR